MPTPKPCRKIHADDLMVIAAFRYSLGRASYIVGACVDWILLNWKLLDANTQSLIVKEIKSAISDRAYGMECDKAQWQRILEHADAHAR